MSPSLRLSILMCSVGDRLDRMKLGYTFLAGQAEAYPEQVEVLALTDNRCRSIGLKRQALLDAARGEYVCFIDDDDDVPDHFVSDIVTAMEQARQRPDVFVFPTLCVSDAYGSMLVDHSISYENESAKVPDFRRKPWFMHPIERGLAQSGRFPDVSWAEDDAWLGQLWDRMAIEIRVSEHPLYTYHWNDAKANPDKPQ